MKLTLSKRKPRGSIKRDKISARDFNKLILPWSCEDCVHFSNLEGDQKFCSIGYQVAHHLREFQLKEYNLGGHMALCRFQEID